jgi:hypothetical protein
MHQNGFPVVLAQPLDGPLAAVTGAVVHHPKDAIGRPVRFDTHHLIHQATERRDARLSFATAHDPTAAHVPTG